MKKKIIGYTLSICNQYCKKPKYRKNAEKNKPITFAAKMVGGGTNISSEMYLHRIAESHDRNMENAPETERATRD